MRRLVLFQALLGVVAGLSEGCSAGGYSALPPSTPVARTVNGTYYGTHFPRYYVDVFQGIPFAAPPTGDLRFQVPQPYNESWSGYRNATELGPACYGTGTDTTIAANNYTSEDCLLLNVYRPAGVSITEPLPVLVWVHGGGYFAGSARNQWYNLTFVVEESVKIGKPIVAVAIQYRLETFGFLYSEEVVNAGVANLGIRDQRQALQWVQQNIGGFGGDPSRVTINGESAGATSVGTHLIAYNGRDDKLFRAVIAQSGSPTGFGLFAASKGASSAYFTTLTEALGCTNATTRLSCLRAVAADDIAIAQGNFTSFGPLPDGDIIAQSPVISMQEGNFVRVPYIIGTNADEGTYFIPFGINTDQDLNSTLIGSGATVKQAADLMQLYPNNPADLVVVSHPEQFNDTIGLQWKRAATVVTDLIFLAPTRQFISRYVENTSNNLWTYLLQSIPNNVPDYYGSTHGLDLAYTFHNFEGVGWTADGPAPFFGGNPFDNVTASHKDLADLLCRSWISFVHDLDPNYGARRPANAPFWPPVAANNRTEIVFDAIKGVYLQHDTFRKNGTDYLERIFVAEAHSA